MGYSTNRLVVSCCSLLKEVYSRFNATKLLGKHSLSALSPLFKSLHRMWESIGQEAPRGGPRLLPQTPYHLCECIFGAVSTLWRFVGIRSYKHFSKKQKQQQQKRKYLHWMENFWGVFAKFAVRSPGVASGFFFFSFFLFFFSLLPGLLLFSYSITLFHLTLPLRKGMQIQIGPIVFNCMHWRVAAQLKCFKCLCLSLKHRGSWHLRQGGRAVTPGSPRSNKPTPGCTTDGKRTGDGAGCLGGNWQLGLVGYRRGRDQAHRQRQRFRQGEDK